MQIGTATIRENIMAIYNTCNLYIYSSEHQLQYNTPSLLYTYNILYDRLSATCTYIPG